MITESDGSVRFALRTALTAAMKARDRGAVSAYRSALSAIDNAGAVPLTEAHRAGALERSSVGVGAGDAARAELSEQQLISIVRAEAAERTTAAEQVQANDPDAADELLRGARLLLDLVRG